MPALMANGSTALLIALTQCLKTDSSKSMRCETSKALRNIQSSAKHFVSQEYIVAKGYNIKLRDCKSRRAMCINVIDNSEPLQEQGFVFLKQ